MEPVLDIAAGTGLALLLLATAFIERFWGRLLTGALVAALAYAVYPIVLRQSLPAFIGGLDAAALQTLAAVLAFDGVLGCSGATLLLRARHAPPLRRAWWLRWVRRLAAYHVGVIPVLALFYLEMKVFDAASEWSFETTALALCAGVVVAGVMGSEALRRLLPDPDLRVELRLLVHVGQFVLAAGLTAYALQGGAESSATALEAGPHAVVAGAVVLGMLAGYWSHRRRLRRLAG